MSLCAGVMVDRLGKEKSMYLFVSFCIVGSAVYALGAAMVNSDPTLRYVVMFAGRFIFGLGGGPITIVQNAFTAIHFNGHELAMAFGCTLTVSRVGSVVNFNVTPSLYDLFYDNVSKVRCCESRISELRTGNHEQQDMYKDCQSRTSIFVRSSCCSSQVV